MTNTGEQALHFIGGTTQTLGLRLAGTAADSFRIDRVAPPTTTPLAPGASVTVVIEFAPAVAARTLGLDATLVVTTDSPETPALNIGLRGDAVPVALSGFTAD